MHWLSTQTFIFCKVCKRGYWPRALKPRNQGGKKKAKYSRRHPGPELGGGEGGATQLFVRVNFIKGKTP